MGNKRIGRPLKDHAPDARVTINVQVPGAFKTKLQERANAAHHSLAHEVVMILEEALAKQEDERRRRYLIQQEKAARAYEQAWLTQNGRAAY